ncbi:unnamed protein product [Urochloa humidicola]
MSSIPRRTGTPAARLLTDPSVSSHLPHHRVNSNSILPQKKITRPQQQPDGIGGRRSPDRLHPRARRSLVLPVLLMLLLFLPIIRFANTTFLLHRVPPEPAPHSSVQWKNAPQQSCVN